jgi:hypothetical protein
MKYTQLLEKIDAQFDSPYDSSAQVRVYKNPNYAEMNHARIRSSFNELRGLVHNTNVVYVWDANLATYDDVIRVYDLTDDQVSRFILGADDDLISADPAANSVQILSSPMIQRMLHKAS